MRWFTIFGVSLGLLGIAFSTNENIRLLGVALISILCFFDLVEKLKDMRHTKNDKY